MTSTITHVGSAAAAATSLTLPAHRAVGDLELMFAFRSGSTSAPTVPAGWTLIKSTTTTSTFGGLYYRWCTSVTDTSGTWTSASDLLCAVYRGTLGVGASATGSAVSSTLSYTALTEIQATSWALGFAGHRTATNVATAPSGMVNRTSAGSGPQVANFDTNGVSSWSTTTVGVNASSGWVTVTCELIAGQSTMNPYDKNSLVTLSTGNLVVAATATTNFQEGVRGTFPHSSGRWLLSTLPQLAGSNPYYSWGVGNASASLNQAGLTLNDICFNFFTSDGASLVKMNTSQIGANLPVWPTNVRLYLAIDLDNKLLWPYINGSWYDNTGASGANPDSGVNGFSFAGIAAGPYFPIISMGDTTSTAAWDGLLLSRPSGADSFAAWDTFTPQTPVGQSDWPDPTLRRGELPRAVDSQPLGSAVALVHATVASPFAQIDWPDPTLRRSELLRADDSQPLGSPDNVTTLVGQDSIYGVPGMVPDYDWPNPVLLRALAAGVTSQPLGAPGNVTVLVGQDALPFRQIDWPNPILRISPDRAINSQANGMPVTEFTSIPLTMQNDIPNPTLRVFRMQALIQSQTAVLNITTLVGQDRFYGAAGEVIAYDWPNPLGPPRHAAAMAAQPLGAPFSLTSAITTAPFGQDDWPNPRGSQPVHQLQSLGSPLLLTTLAGQDSLPLRQRDWPNPVLRLSAVAAIAAQPLGAPLNVTTLVGQDKLPLSQDDWPNPVLRVSAVAAINAQPAGCPLNITLLPGQDRLPFRELDWPNPILRPSHVAALAAQPLGQTTPIEEAEVVASQDDWPVPPGPQPRTQTQPLGSPLNLTLLVGQDTLPIRQRDWPNPVLRISSVAAINAQPAGSALILTTLVGKDALPFRATDWPVPPGARQPERQPPLGSPLIVTTLVGQDALPRRQIDWPNPRDAQQPTQTQPLGMPSSYLAPPTPNSQHDWPVPAGPRQPTHTQPYGTPSILTLLVGKDALPVRQQDWPNPRLATQPVQTQPLGVPAFRAAAPTPVAPLDWPNPPGAKQPVQTQPYGSPGVLSTLAGQDRLPIRLLDWPNPRGAATWIVALNAQPEGGKTADPPLRPVDIINPVGPSRFVALISQRLGRVFPVEPVPVLPVDLPVPTPRAVPATLSQPLGSPLLLTLLPGQDALPFRQSDWPNPPGAQPHMQTGPEGIPATVPKPAQVIIINKPRPAGSIITPGLSGSETPVALGGTLFDINLSGGETQANLQGESKPTDLSGEVDQ